MTARALLLGPALLLCAAAPAVQDAGTTVSVTVEGLRSARGQVLACLTANPRDFPDCNKDPAARHLSIAAAPGETLVFRDVPPGRYALSMFHDENGNGKLDKLLMMPKEGFGFSRDAPVRFGPPSFKAAAFDVSKVDVRTQIRMRYMF
ncbi:DUF2141 domain-containing protein [Novosphingobium sp. ZN18A2]|uniref:DUF2141 domain-containing protein n=1 Tax=Novosphingobium sp. ZN18A2 TaxID=3079861 RepID=UPI0030D044AF